MQENEERHLNEKTTSSSGLAGKLDNFFEISKRGSSIGVEIFAGLATFLAMAYILTVNPTTIVGADSPKWASVFIATVFGAFTGTLLMALLAKLPYAQAPGMVSLALSTADVIKNWRIDWGDGSPNTTLSELSSKQVFSHYYAQDGEYEVSVEIVDVNGLGTGVWSNIGKLTVVGVGQSSNAILEVVAEQETLTSELETAASEIAAAFQSTDDNECVAKEDSACMPFIPKSSEERFYGPQDLRKKTKRPLSLF